MGLAAVAGEVNCLLWDVADISRWLQRYGGEEWALSERWLEELVCSLDSRGHVLGRSSPIVQKD